MTVVLGGAGACSPAGVGLVSRPGVRLRGSSIAPDFLIPGERQGDDPGEDGWVLDLFGESLRAPAGGRPSGDLGWGHAASPPWRRAARNRSRSCWWMRRARRESRKLGSAPVWIQA